MEDDDALSPAKWSPAILGDEKMEARAKERSGAIMEQVETLYARLADIRESREQVAKQGAARRVRDVRRRLAAAIFRMPIAT